ncbi:MAG: hypothetical protein ACK41T_00790 [Pseudobdellovibrio sp.]
MLKLKKKYDATVSDCGVMDNGGEPVPYVDFELINEENKQIRQRWFMNLKSEKSTNFAVTTLVKIGFKGNDFNDLKTGVIMFDKSPNITLEFEHPEKNGIPEKDKFKIKYINTKNKTPNFEGTVPSQVALFAKIKSELGIKTKTNESKPNTDW